MQRLGAVLRRETYALPVDIFRVLVGLLAFAYFVRTFLESESFSSVDGLIDHELVGNILWFSRIGLFQPGIGLLGFQLTYLGACVACLAIVFGYRTKLFALLLYLVAVSTYRWNFLVMYVDDAIVHLLLFWMLLLPVGRTLNVEEWLRRPKGSWERWKLAVVPGTTVWCFMGNVAIIYLVAGLWKFTSPMWLDGTALYATLRMPISYAPDFWGPQHLPILKVLNYLSLGFEPLIPLLFFLRKNHPIKWIGWILVVGFHAGIALTLRIPFANLALIAAGVLLFRGEIMAWLHRRVEAPALDSRSRIDLAGRIALVFLLVLALAMTRRIPGIREVHKPAYAILYLAGIAQDYQLFNWVHKKNIHCREEIFAGGLSRGEEPLADQALFPSGIRGILLRSYLYGVRWIKIPRERQVELRRSLLDRAARRYCREYEPRDRMLVTFELQRITRFNLDLDQGTRRKLTTFKCDGQDLKSMQPNLHIRPPVSPFGKRDSSSSPDPGTN